MPPLAPRHSGTGALGIQGICPEAAMATRTMWIEAGDALLDTLPIIVLGTSGLNKKKEPKH